MTAKPFSSIKGDYVRLENAKVENNAQANEPEEECATRRVLNICINVVILLAVALACGSIGYNLRSPSDSCSRGSDHGMYERERQSFRRATELNRFHDTSRQHQIPYGVQSDIHKGANG